MKAPTVITKDSIPLSERLIEVVNASGIAEPLTKKLPQNEKVITENDRGGEAKA